MGPFGTVFDLPHEQEHQIPAVQPPLPERVHCWYAQFWLLAPVVQFGSHRSGFLCLQTVLQQQAPAVNLSRERH